ncbi:transmembrane gamma-carboxyglutamic acid protein 1 [Lepisosteus oculatus]|uniref:Proline rich Gla (G-carboxyglutamic acid) 1 n=1 Tax=Lepisosteus oculatus TaxID=7918 RepID=W5MVI5_LEPOC|nr:PREDICTED: transmembrane gamma-carboxyglutamic acid protein 1-like [Lepisosteus oculatus]XP_015219802.1 PREDICTED: transmembrane gamma-carboxyglutamic acid protein 1-like [Lepisosteus oculatus]XP_015219803.1 PREDICTED: transmembrane gamma-carboxyglutamic acid protein 1-like [Lepisosteus oculatus]XP_015219804.1 PREDICTED: transmembrane gamma-carboxyglutamic acid protein 1-like [Lepisosteus oculatus]XP_015219805.1 PREDICTED: transmembrane gamma-carboxyglutamic acid protein 1-like [Lepisosteus 
MGSVFLSPNQANSLLKRFPRANSLMEEFKQGNIQRECREEICSYEEAREAFENDEKTRVFWDEYVRESSPGSSLDLGSSRFHSVYLVVPLLTALALIVIVLVAVWRCHSRKLFQRGSAFGPRREGPGRPERALSLEPMDRLGPQCYYPDASPPSDLTPGRLSGGDPPPSYEEATGRVEVRIEAGAADADPPPQYDDIVSAGPNSSVLVGDVK